MSSSCWRASGADDKTGDTASSISDVFTDVRCLRFPVFVVAVDALVLLYSQMLNVNEDLIAATAECQAEGDMDGLIA